MAIDMTIISAIHFDKRPISGDFVCYFWLLLVFVSIFAFPYFRYQFVMNFGRGALGGQLRALGRRALTWKFGIKSFRSLRLETQTLRAWNSGFNERANFASFWFVPLIELCFNAIRPTLRPCRTDTWLLGVQTERDQRLDCSDRSAGEPLFFESWTAHQWVTKRHSNAAL